jgi:hypothetical protein
MSVNQVPPQNLDAFGFLFSIENSLRELIVEELSAISGAQWFKRRLPGDVLEKFREGVRFERKVKWVQLVPHHPIYYVDFPDLRKIILRSDNWKDAFHSIFQSEEVLEGTLTEIEFIRNKVAHNRKINRTDLGILSAARTKLATSIGEERFVRLAASCTHLSSVAESANELLALIEESYACCRRFEVCRPETVWRSVLGQWWFDPAFLDGPTEDVVSFFQLIAEYNALPRHRGEGHKLEQWLNSSGIAERYNAAKRTLLHIF